MQLFLSIDFKRWCSLFYLLHAVEPRLDYQLLTNTGLERAAEIEPMEPKSIETLDYEIPVITNNL